MAGFSSRHGTTTATAEPDGLRLLGADGATAELSLPFPPWTPPDPTQDAMQDAVQDAVQEAGVGRLVEAARDHAVEHRDVAVLLVRRGGYACVFVSGGAVAASKVGSRYVQGRTAAGGWSQQRFARRREKQAHELEKAVVEVAERVLLQGVAPRWLVTGGDRPLVDAVLADARLRRLADLPRGPHLAVGDPDRALVAALPQRLTTVTIRVSGPS